MQDGRHTIITNSVFCKSIDIDKCIDIDGKTNRSFAADSCSPRRRVVNNAKVFLDTIWARSWLGDAMSGCGFYSLDLDEAFGAYSLVTTARMIDVGRVILEEQTRVE